MSSKILVSCFEPFGGESINASMSAVQALDGVEKVLLPVVFDECWTVLKKKIDECAPSAVICVGQAPYECVKAEVYAHNVKRGNIADNAGFKANGEKIEEDGEYRYMTSLNISSFPALSQSAGEYVCNNIYYHLLHYVATQSPTLKGLFVHVPSKGELSVTIEHLKQIVDSVKNQLQ